MCQEGYVWYKPSTNVRSGRWCKGEMSDHVPLRRRGDQADASGRQGLGLLQTADKFPTLQQLFPPHRHPLPPPLPAICLGLTQTRMKSLAPFPSCFFVYCVRGGVEDAVVGGGCG
jgi:hypothetical protein